MHKEVFWSDQAKLDMQEITDFLLIKWNINVVEDFYTKIDDFIHHIGRTPQSFPLINRKEGIRKCVVSWHNSIYYVDELEFIEILRISDNRQNPTLFRFL
jgi:plasmid stabilization system protein ParE